MKYFENTEITPEIILGLLYSKTLEYAKKYHISLFKAYNGIAWNLFDFSSGHGQTKSTKKEYTEKILDIAANKVITLSELEIKAIYSYFQDFPRTFDKDYSGVEAEIKAEITSKNAYNQKLTDGTAAIRHLIDNAYFLLGEDELMYIEYCRNVRSRDELLLCNDMYILGFIAGKRAERTRRKAQSANT